MLYRLIYRSVATPGVTDTDYRTIAMFSSMRNKSMEITGLLLTSGPQIMQVLEGPKEAVKTLYASIEKDPRHKDVTVVSEGEVAAREFTEWSMGFRPVQNSYELDMFFALTQKSMEDKLSNVAAEDVRAAAQDFRAQAELD